MNTTKSYQRAWQNLRPVVYIGRAVLTTKPDPQSVEMSGLPDRRVALFPGEQSYWNQRDKPVVYDGLRTKN